MMRGINWSRNHKKLFQGEKMQENMTVGQCVFGACGLICILTVLFISLLF